MQSYSNEQRKVGKTEEWRDIPNYEGYYQASSLGRIKSLKRAILTKRGVIRWLKEKVLSFNKHNGGYYSVTLRKWNRNNDFLVHRLVLLAFVGPCPKGKEVRHLDGNKRNNRPENLRYDTREVNCEDRWRHGTNGRKLNQDKVDKIRMMYRNGEESAKNMAKMFSVSEAHIYAVIKGSIWKYSLKEKLSAQ